jgi:hypothetical protein
MSPPVAPRADKPRPRPVLAPSPKPVTKKGPNDPAVPSPRDAKAPRSDPGLALPHERDESPENTAAAPDAAISQAPRDIEADQVDAQHLEGQA